MGDIPCGQKRQIAVSDLYRGLLGGGLAKTSSGPWAVAPTAASTAATPAAVTTPETTVDAALTEGLHVLALLLTSPLATAGLLATVFGSVFRFAGDVVEE